MRILMVTSSYPTGDAPWAGRFVAELAAALEAAGNEVMVTAPHAETWDDASGLPLAASLSSGSGVFYGSGVEHNLKSNPLRVFPLAVDIIKALPKLSLAAALSDLVMVHWLYPYGAAVARMRSLWNRPVVVVLHSVNPVVFRFSPFTARAVMNADMFVAVSDAVKDAFLSALPGTLSEVAQHKIRVLPLGTRQRVGIVRRPHTGPLRVLFLGRLLRIKGPDIVVDAVRSLPGVTLTVAGAGPMTGALKKRADPNNTRFIGAVHPDEVDDLMNAHDCLVLPSRKAMGGRQEGMPMVLKEAAVSGLPVVVSPFGGAMEFVEKHGCGKVLQDLDKKVLRHTLMELQQDPQQLTALSENALSIADTLTWPSVISGWVSALNTL